MTKEQKVIKKCKKIVNLPYNKFNLNNYLDILVRNFKVADYSDLNYELSSSSPIKMMSNCHPNAGIITNKTETKKKNIYIVGKGILFDSGGYNIKIRGMESMKTDMAGMATAIAVSEINKKATYYCPVSTNLMNSKILPGDYLNIGDKIVEVTNTDAEGRLILAEALSNLEVTKDDIVITVATLTGACAYALGDKATAFLTPNKKLTHAYKKASAKAGELAWRLPLWSYIEKKHFNKKTIKNSINEKCGTISAGLFLKQFIKYPDNWIHLDIASSAYNDKKERATGVPVKSLVNFVNNLK